MARNLPRRGYGALRLHIQTFSATRRDTMPGKKHLRGVGEKEQREYEHIKKSAEKSGRYGDRAEEVAARYCDEAAQRARPQEGTIAPVRAPHDVVAIFRVLGF